MPLLETDPSLSQPAPRRGQPAGHWKGILAGNARFVAGKRVRTVDTGHDAALRAALVKAVREAHGKPLPGNLWALQAGMAGLLESTPEVSDEGAAAYGARLEAANARRQAQALLDRSDLLRERTQSGRLRVVPALYHLDTGKVEFLKPAQVVGTAPSAHH